jgi:hypothetical protein
MTASARIPVVSESARSHRRSRGDQRAERHAPASSDGQGGQGSPRRRTPDGRGRRRLLERRGGRRLRSRRYHGLCAGQSDGQQPGRRFDVRPIRLRLSPEADVYVCRPAAASPASKCPLYVEPDIVSGPRLPPLCARGGPPGFEPGPGFEVGDGDWAWRGRTGPQKNGAPVGSAQCDCSPCWRK